MSDIKVVMEAKDARTLFGVNEKRARIMYRRLARSVHPDMVEAGEKNDANAAFGRLTELWGQWNAQNSPGASTGNTASPSAPSETITTSKHTYTVVERPSGDPFFARMNVTYNQGSQAATVLISANPRNNDLADNHVQALKTLRESVPERFHGFYPHVLESFHYRVGNADHRSIVQSHHLGFVPFSEILSVYPEGINGRDVAWIFRRMLVAIGNAHDIGLVHGAVSMDSLSIHPEEHGVILSDWQYSVKMHESLKAFPRALKSDYPKFALNKEPVNSSLDINLCGKVANNLLEKSGPRQMRRFFSVCMNTRIHRADILLNEFDRMLKGLYGEPKFHSFTLEPGAAR